MTQNTQAELENQLLDELTEALVNRLAKLPDDKRLQKKYETLTEIMNGESANASANIWVTLMADFAIACANFGFEPKMVLLNIGRDARKMVEQKLKEQGLTLTAPEGAKPN